MIIIINCGMGNLGSIANMLKKVGVEAVVSSEAVVIEQADKLILLGAGAFDKGMAKLDDLGIIPSRLSHPCALARKQTAH